MGRARAIWIMVLAGAAAAQTTDDSFRVYSEPPRLLLNAGRLQRLRRERERQAMRWQQFAALLTGGAAMPEPGFAKALYYRITDDRRVGAEAVAWALRPAADARQVALVFDWCQDLLDRTQSAALAARLQPLLTRPIARVPDARDTVFAALALAGAEPGASAAALQRVVREWWEGRVIPSLRTVRPLLPRDDDYALFELLHAIRDNLNLDLRESAPKWFQDLPTEHLLSYYPAIYQAPENEFRIPAAPGAGEPDLRRAARYRAAELSMVAFDTNAPESQSLQGWLMHDRFLLRGAFGIPYEFLWANPYQPGLTYFHVPLTYHNASRGILYIRASWDDSAEWLGFFDGHLQMFRDGAVVPLDPRRLTKPPSIGSALVQYGSQPFSLDTGEEAPCAFLIGLQPFQTYGLEVDREEMRDEKADAGGILVVDLPAHTHTGVRVKAR